MKMNTFTYITIFLLLFINSLHADIKIDNSSKQIIVLNKSEIYYDEKNEENINTLIKRPELFHPFKKEFINYGLKNKSPIWVKFTLHNISSKTIQKTISIDELRLEHIKLFTVKDNKIINSQKSGSFHRKKFNGILMPHFNVQLLPNEKKTFYLKVFSPSYALAFKALITTYENFIYKDIKYHLIWGIFIGILITILIYNFFLYLLTTNSLYFYYSLYILGILASRKVHYLIWLHIFPMHDPSAVEKEISLIVYYTNFTVLTMALFTQHFLQTKLYPKLHRFLNFIIIIIVLHSFITSPSFLSYQDIAPLYLILIIFYFCIGFYALYKKNKNAPYFILGWSLGLLAWIFALLHGLNIWSVKYEFFYITETLITIEVFFFSYAISQYIKELNKEKEFLSQKLITQKENENILLEKKVKEKTSNLNNELEKNRFLLQELNHRVKNNMQFITTLYSLKLENANEKNIQEKLRDIERKIFAMSQFHQMLYKEKNIKSIDATVYLKKIIETIKNSFDLYDVSFTFNIDAKLEIEEAIYCGLIVNELVTNAMKYAFPKNKGNIEITLTEDEKFKYLKVKDSGIGIQNNSSNGFGQTMIEILAKEQLNGTIDTYIENGTKIEIVFPKSKY